MAPGVDEITAAVPRAVTALLRRGVDFPAAEDAVQDALVDALRTEVRPRDAEGWLIATAWRRFLDHVRSEQARGRREEAFGADHAVEVPADPQEVGTVDQADDSLALYFLCAHPSLSPASATALTLRAVGGLTTAQIATAFLVPETTMAQRISRAKRSLRDVRLGRSGDIRVVLRVLYLVFNEGFTGDVDLAEEAIRITRMLRVRYDHEEVSGLLSLMLLHHARRAARLSADGVLVPLPEQDRSRWDTAVIGEGVGILQEALARDRRGPYQVQAAIAALHDDARTAAETDWPQILDWYDDLLGLEDTPVVRLNRIVALAEVHGADAGLEELATLDPRLPRFTAVEAHLRERNGEMTCAAELFSQASREARNVPEREHLRERAHRAADAAVAADRAGSRVHS